MWKALCILTSNTFYMAWTFVEYGVPQGSGLGPVLYLIFLHCWHSILARQMVISMLTTSKPLHLCPRTMDCPLNCLFATWMSANRPSLDSAKTQLICFETRQQLLKRDLPYPMSVFLYFTYSPCVRGLGVNLDGTPAFSEHLMLLTRSCYYKFRRLKATRRSV